jgi:type II secretion system protein H
MTKNVEMIKGCHDEARPDLTGQLPGAATFQRFNKTLQNIWLIVAAWRKSVENSGNLKDAAFCRKPLRRFGRGRFSGYSNRRRAFTLIELIFVLALLVIITSIAVPRMSGFIRGRALDSESRQLMALMHAAQSRAVSEGMPMMLWINAPAGQYGFAAETSGKDGDPKAETLTLDGVLKISVQNGGAGAAITFGNVPAIRFLPDGTVDEGSPPTVQLSDQDGFGRWLVEAPNRTGYEISDRNK